MLVVAGVTTKTNRLAFVLWFISEGILRTNAFVQQRRIVSLENTRRPFQETYWLQSKQNDALSSFERFLERLPTSRARSEKDRNPTQLTTTLSNGRMSLLLLQTEAILAPAVEFLDDRTDGWALGYADLTPESEETIIGRSFLATNIAYSLVGVMLSVQGETLLGFMTEIVSVASFFYHYAQLQQPYMRTTDSMVKLALMVDYILAVTSIFIGLVYLVTDHNLPPIEGVISCILAIGCLLACWRWEKGLPYILLHSLWHFFSAARYVTRPLSVRHYIANSPSHSLVYVSCIHIW
jgi:hypothetical protein